MNRVRRAETGDIPAILELLVQVDMVHHNGRPDLFKGPAVKYNAAELEQILADEGTPVFVCVDEKRTGARARILYPPAFRRRTDGGTYHAVYRRYLRG